jgi:hypothetical protein
MMRLLLPALMALLCVNISSESACAKEEIVPRTIIALYENHGEGLDASLVHLMAEMPLNHLGLNVEFHEVHSPLPDIKNRQDVRGVITWFYSNTKFDNPAAYLQWASEALDAGKKFVIIGALGVPSDKDGSWKSSNKFLNRIGIDLTVRWLENPLDTTYTYLSPELFLETAPFNWMRPPYQVVKAVGNTTQVHLMARRSKRPSDDCALIITSPAGGYISSEYAYRENIRNGDGVRQWIIDPFEFFRRAYATYDLPKPDTTTIAGRRIYYSHIDGDGWNNISQVEEYRAKPTLSARVIMDKLIKPYPDMPVSLTLIAADIDPKWAAVLHSRAVAKEFFALSQVEAGSHTYSHPFYWQFFEHYTPAEEVKYLPFYLNPTWKPSPDLLAAQKAAKQEASPMPTGYKVPRAYAHEVFDIHKEIKGALQTIAVLLPKDKKMEIVTWPGNCLPWEEVLRMTREAGVKNINGGDSRFDPEYPTPGSLAPVGRQVGKERQIYSSASNENTYTNLWSENFHAQIYLQKTLKNSEIPMRLKPINIYYHIYSGERDASLYAVRSNIEYARSQDIVPVTASHFTRIAEGFYSTELIATAPRTWKISHRGALQTIRFDFSSQEAVDFKHSKGVVGERYLHGSLYVYLDNGETEPVITLKDNNAYFVLPQENAPYLIESRWLISNVSHKKNQLNFTAQGYGAGEMIWQMPMGGHYLISTGKEKQEATVKADGRLKVTLKTDALKQPVRVSITSI